MGNVENLKGQRFGKWKVVSRLPSRGHNTLWKCRCDCGTEAPVQAGSLKDGSSTQCVRCRVDGTRKG